MRQSHYFYESAKFLKIQFHLFQIPNTTRTGRGPGASETKKMEIFVFFLSFFSHTLHFLRLQEGNPLNLFSSEDQSYEPYLGKRVYGYLCQDKSLDMRKPKLKNFISLHGGNLGYFECENYCDTR